jgi:hypothetical protein
MKGNNLSFEGGKRNRCYLIKKGEVIIKKRFDPNLMVRWIHSCSNMLLDNDDILVFQKFQTALLNVENSEEEVIGIAGPGELVIFFL